MGCRAVVLVLAAALAAIPAACGPARPGRPAWSGTREVVGGVEVVRNPDRPLWPDDSVRVERLWSAPSPAAADSLGLWQAPSGVAEAGGRVYVLDEMAHRIYVLDAATGGWTRAFGREGEGPGELKSPVALLASHSGIVLDDFGNASLERFGPDGTYRGSLHVDRMSFDLFSLGGQSLLMQTGGTWQRVDPEGHLTPFPWPESPPSAPAPDTTRLRIGASGGLVFRLDAYRPLFQVIDTSGMLRRVVLIDRPPAETPARKLDSLLQGVRRSGAPAARIQFMQHLLRTLYAHDPRMRAVQCDPMTGRLLLWEQEPDDLGGGPARLDVFSHSGVYLATHAFADAWVGNGFAVSGSVVYALTRDPATDLVRLTAYRMTIPRTTPPS